MKRRTLLQGLAFAPWLLSPALLRAAEPSLAHGFGRMPPGTDVQRIFAAGPPASILVYCLAPEKLLGWPSALQDAARELLAPAGNLPGVGRLAGRGSTLSMEALLALRPDLIVDIGVADQTHLSLAQRSSEQSGIPWVLFDGRLHQAAEMLRQAGRWCGVDGRGERLARVAEEIIHRASTRMPVEAGVYMARGHDGLETGLGGSIHCEALELAGLRNVARNAGTGGLARVSLEQLLVWQPERILCQDTTVHRHILGSSAWRSLRAVRMGRVYPVPALPFGWLDVPPGINRLLGLDWLLALDSPTDAQALPERTRHFFRLFYGHDLSAAQLRRLLESHPGVGS